MMLVLTIIFLGLDILSKLAVYKHLVVNKSIILINNFLSITYAKNTGVAWSLFDGAKYFIIGVSLVVIIGIIIYLSKHKPKYMVEKIAFSMILGGALGNFLNRIFYGYVIDFIDVKIFNYNYPIFNLADTFIVVGVIMVIIFDWWGSNARNRGSK